MQVAHERGREWLTAGEIIREVLAIDQAVNTGTTNAIVRYHCINDPSKKHSPGRQYRSNPLLVTDDPRMHGKSYRLLTEEERRAFLSNVRDDLETMSYSQLMQWLPSPDAPTAVEPLPRSAIPGRPALTTKRQRTSDRMERRVNDLIAGFDQYVQAFNDGNPFSGPSIYFHHKTLAILRQHSTPCSALHSDEFLDYLYATLTSWGMHRMGPGGAKLADMSQIKDSFVHQEASIREVQSLSLCTISSAHVSRVTSRVWSILDSLRVGTSGTKLVANSKALHHLLPALVPPIDRAYTLRFFYDNTTLSKGDEATFKEIYPYFHRIAVTRRDQITPHLGTGMNTSETKVIDNAIVGFVRTHLVESRQRIQRRSGDLERN